MLSMHCNLHKTFKAGVQRASQMANTLRGWESGVRGGGWGALCTPLPPYVSSTWLLLSCIHFGEPVTLSQVFFWFLWVVPPETFGDSFLCMCTHPSAKNPRDCPMQILHFPLLWYPGLQILVSSAPRSTCSLIYGDLHFPAMCQGWQKARLLVSFFSIKKQGPHKLFSKAWKHTPHRWIQCHSCLCRKCPSSTSYFFMARNRIPVKYKLRITVTVVVIVSNYH